MVMLITGTSKGIGKYLAQYYSDKGYQVIGCSRGQIDYKFDNYEHYCLDITDEGNIRQMFLEVRKKYGRCDILINNAAIMATNSAILTPLATVQKILNINVSGTFLTCREAIKIMHKNKFGRIINFTSMSAPLNIAGEAIYGASKSAIITFTKILAKELGQSNITVNAIGPSIISTDIIASLNKDKIAKIIDLQAIKRAGEFGDVTNVIDFYIRPESNFITGQVIYLGGIC
jgi:3-oxoacyl-[acyl-carrier protein] reductase